MRVSLIIFLPSADFFAHHESLLEAMRRSDKGPSTFVQGAARRENIRELCQDDECPNHSFDKRVDSHIQPTFYVQGSSETCQTAAFLLFAEILGHSEALDQNHLPAVRKVSIVTNLPKHSYGTSTT